MSTNIPYSSSNCKKLPSKSFKNSFTIKVSCLLVTFFLFTFLESFWILRIKFYYIRSPLRLNFHIVDFFVIITHLWPWSKSKFNLKSDRVNLVAPASSIKRLLYLLMSGRYSTNWDGERFTRVMPFYFLPRRAITLQEWINLAQDFLKECVVLLWIVDGQRKSNLDEKAYLLWVCICNISWIPLTWILIHASTC